MHAELVYFRYHSKANKISFNEILSSAQLVRSDSFIEIYTQVKREIIFSHISFSNLTTSRLNLIHFFTVTLEDF